MADAVSLLKKFHSKTIFEDVKQAQAYAAFRELHGDEAAQLAE